VKVALSLGSQAFQKQLASTLAAQGLLRSALSFGFDLEVLVPDASGALKSMRQYPHSRLVNRILWAAWRRLPGAQRSRHLPVVLSTMYADRLMSRHISNCDIFHGFTGLSLACLRAARRMNAVTLIENPSMHPRAWQRAVLEECNRFGVRPRDCRAVLPSALIRRMEAEFDRCDFIVVPSAVAQKSFSHPRDSGKARIIHAGIDHQFFAPPLAGRSDRTFRVCYTGRVELAKGMGYLLQAWKQIGLKNAELVLIGEVAPEMKSLIREYLTPSVRFTGFQPPEQVRNWYRNSDVFAFPSVNEGLARVLLEAMSTGLPVIATPASGAEDCVTPGKNGTIIPERNPDALAEALLWHHQNRNAARAMGSAAREAITSHFTIAHYEERMISFYRSLLPRSAE
jgi:glycosyltransferase involved in cell wall biosynthesis